MKIDKRSLGFAFVVLALANLGCSSRGPGCDGPYDCEDEPTIVDDSRDIRVTRDYPSMDLKIERGLQELEVSDPTASALEKLLYLYALHSTPPDPDRYITIINPVTRELLLEAFQDADGEQLPPELCEELCYQSSISHRTFVAPPRCSEPPAQNLDVALSCEAQVYDTSAWCGPGE